MTRIDVTATVPVAAASLDDPERFLPSPARPSGPGRFVVDFAIGAFHHEGVVTLGPTWRTEGRAGRRAVAAEGADHEVTGSASGAAMQAEMERLMQESIGAFPAETEGTGAALLEPEILEDGTKFFDNVVAEEVMILNDAGNIGLFLNGKSFPATAPYQYRQGDRVVVHDAEVSRRWRRRAGSPGRRTRTRPSPSRGRSRLPPRGCRRAACRGVGSTGRRRPPPRAGRSGRRARRGCATG